MDMMAPRLIDVSDQLFGYGGNFVPDGTPAAGEWLTGAVAGLD